MPGIFLASVFRMEGHPKDQCMGQHIHFVPTCFKLTDSRMKRGGMEEIMVNCFFLTSLVWSVPPHPECWCKHLHIPFPLHWIFHPWSSKEASENILKNAWSFLLTHPRGVLPVWCWAGGRHFALCGAFSFSLALWVGSSRMVVAHLVCSAHTLVHKGVPIMGVMRRSWFWWRTHEHPVCWFFHKVWRDAFCNPVFHFTQLLLPHVFDLSPSFVGIGFSQDQVTWLQWNGIGLAIIVSPLPFSLRWELCLYFFESFLQFLMQVSNIVVDKLAFFCVGLSFCCMINSGTDSLIQNMFWLQKTSFQALWALHQVWRQPNNNALIWVAKLTWACLLAIGAVVKP